MKRPLVGVLLALSLVLTACGGGSGGGSGSKPAAKGITLTETGSTLMLPLFNLWAPAYTRAHPSVKLNTQGTGSGTGIADAANGTADIGASDAYLSPALKAQSPALANIPLAISAQLVMFNLPGIAHLHLNGPVLAAIYMGRVARWNDPAIAALNPGVSLPDLPIVPVRRTDGSGDTFLFTQYLSFTAPAWKVGYNTTVNWPSVPGEIGAVGNAGVLQALTQTKGAVGYVGISYLDEARKSGLGYAALENKAGQFVLPTPASVSAGAAALAGNLPSDLAASLVDAPGATTYPITNFEYAIVNTAQPDAATAKAIRGFLTWAVDPSGGSAPSFLDKVHFVPLPAGVRQKALALIARIR